LLLYTTIIKLRVKILRNNINNDFISAAEEKPFYMPKWYKIITLILAYGVLGWGIFISVIGWFQAGIWFILLGIGEVGLFHILKIFWFKMSNKFTRNKPEKFGFWRFFLMGWAFAMLMEFCVDFGAYGTIDPVFVLLVMIGLTPIYITIFIGFRISFRWFTYTPTEAFFTIGTMGALIESLILKVMAGTFDWGYFLLFPFEFPIHALNYGGAAVIPTFFQNQVEQREFRKNYGKYIVGIAIPLMLALLLIILIYPLILGR